MNLDRSIQSFSVPVGGANISSIGFHAPPQEPGWPNDGTFNNQGYSSTPWAVDSESSARSPGAAKPLPQTRTPTRFALAHCIAFGLTPISRRKLSMPRSGSLKQVRR